MVESIHHFEIHLCDKTFTVFTDHKALTNLLSSTHLNRKLWRWALYIQQFCVSFKYRPGKDSVVADYLSRQAWPTAEQPVPALEPEQRSASGGKDTSSTSWMSVSSTTMDRDKIEPSKNVITSVELIDPHPLTLGGGDVGVAHRL